MVLGIESPRLQDEDATAHLADQSRRSHHAIRMRIQPQLYVESPVQENRGNYHAWRNVYWNLRLDRVEDVLAIKEALKSFFAVLVRIGPQRMKLMLDSYPVDVVESAPSSHD